MKIRLHPYYVLLIAIILSCSSSSSPENSSEGRVNFEGDLLGAYDVVQLGASFKNFPFEFEEIDETWVFTADSIYISHSCYVEKSVKSNGGNFKTTWYDIEESVFTHGDTTIIRVEQKSPNSMTREYYLLKNNTENIAEEILSKPADWDCIKGSVWQFRQVVDKDRKPIFSGDLNFQPIEKLDFRENNSANFKFSKDTLYYSENNMEHAFLVEYIEGMGDMRLVPVSQCQCTNQFANYLRD